MSEWKGSSLSMSDVARTFIIENVLDHSTDILAYRAQRTRIFTQKQLEVTIPLNIDHRKQF